MCFLSDHIELTWSIACLRCRYNVSKDYDHAIAAFQKAIQFKPDDHSLWNKLGATRANSNRSEEVQIGYDHLQRVHCLSSHRQIRLSQAIPAYHRALSLKPRFARGQLNLGISHSNIGSFEEVINCVVCLNDYSLLFTNESVLFHSQAMRHYLSALALNPKGYHIWSFIRNAARALGRMDLAHKANMRDLRAFQAEFDIPFLEQQGPPVDPLV